MTLRERFTVHSQMSPDINTPSCCLAHLLFCCLAQTCHSDGSTSGGSDGRIKGRGQQEEVVFFGLSSPYKDKQLLLEGHNLINYGVMVTDKQD